MLTDNEKAIFDSTTIEKNEKDKKRTKVKSLERNIH